MNTSMYVCLTQKIFTAVCEKNSAAPSSLLFSSLVACLQFCCYKLIFQTPTCKWISCFVTHVLMILCLSASCLVIFNNCQHCFDVFNNNRSQSQEMVTFTESDSAGGFFLFYFEVVFLSTVACLHLCLLLDCKLFLVFWKLSHSLTPQNQDTPQENPSSYVSSDSVTLKTIFFLSLECCSGSSIQFTTHSPRFS